jgi:hypothetical protein
MSVQVLGEPAGDHAILRERDAAGMISSSSGLPAGRNAVLGSTAAAMLEN